MKLPGVDRAVLDAAKVRGYLLSDSHPVGRFKAVFFSALGYSATDWERLVADLLRHVTDNEAVATEANEYGQKPEVRGSLQGTTSREAPVVSVWIVLRGEDFPRFVTAYPGAGR